MVNDAELAQRSALGAVALGVLTILLLGWALLSASQETTHSQGMVQHTERLLRTIASTETSLALSESAYRGFLLTGDSQFLRAQQAAVRQLREDRAALDSAVIDDPTERERIQRVATLVGEYLSMADKFESGPSKLPNPTGNRLLSAALLNQSTARIHALLAEAEAEQKRVLSSRIDGDARDQVWMRHLLVVAGILIVGLMLAVLWGLIRYSRGQRQAEYRLRSIAHSLPGTVFVLRRTPKGVIAFDFLSANAGKMLGISREHVLRDANATRQVVLEEDRDQLTRAVTRSAEELSGLEVEFRVHNPDGSIRWIHSSGIPVRRSNGDIVWNGYWTDITNIKKTEKALRDAMQRLDDAHTVAGLGDWTCDLATGALTWSPQIYQMLGRDKTLGPPDLAEAVDLFDGGARATADAFFKAQETGAPQSYEMTARLETTELLTVQVIVVPTLDETGTVVGMRGTMQDISSRKALEDRLYLAKEAADSANLAKSDFLAMMSHEIRTPLNGMLGILELLEQTPINPELRTALDTIHESGVSLRRIIDDILDFSKVEAGKLDIRPEPTSLADLAASVQRAYAGNASSQGLELRHHVDPRVSPVVMVDALRLRQILGNFVSNAIKFTQSGYVELRITLMERQGDAESLCFEIEDTGIGIAPERQERLFQPFEQADVDLASRFTGTGLGLSISRRLARLMGGEVGMSSELGKGTTMSLMLRVTATDQLVAASATEQDAASVPTRSPDSKFESGDQSKPHSPVVLVVDDHPINRMVMRKQLHTLGYASDEAESGSEALAQWASGRYALILTDCNMPRMSGYELTRRVRESESERGIQRTPIIACSANVIHGAREACLDAGMDDYIPKPTKLLVLADIMLRWLPLPPTDNAEESFYERDVPADSTGQNEVLDSRILHTLSNGDLFIEQRALAHFRKINNADAALLIEAAQRSDIASVARLAHRIKGACGFVGATGLTSACASLEHAGRAGNVSDIGDLMKKFRSELEELNAHLDTRRRFLESNGGQQSG